MSNLIRSKREATNKGVVSRGGEDAAATPRADGRQRKHKNRKTIGYHRLLFVSRSQSEHKD